MVLLVPMLGMLVTESGVHADESMSDSQTASSNENNDNNNDSGGIIIPGGGSINNGGNNGGIVNAALQLDLEQQQIILPH